MGRRCCVIAIVVVLSKIIQHNCCDAGITNIIVIGTGERDKKPSRKPGKNGQDHCRYLQ